MSYFLSLDNLELGRPIEITGDEARHILFARRIKVGEKIILQGPDNNRFRCEVVSFTKKAIIARPLEQLTTPEESKLNITLFQALISEQALDYILQKSTELGVSKVIIFNSRNTPSHLKEKVAVKLVRWQKITQEAAKQSNRLGPPEIVFFEDAQAVIPEMQKADKVFLLEKTAEKGFADLASETYSRLGIIVGPEGAFTDEELKYFSELNNLEYIKLGPRVLRADTAAVTAAAVIQSLWGDM